MEKNIKIFIVLLSLSTIGQLTIAQNTTFGNDSSKKKKR